MLGLCASPRGLANFTGYRKYVGPSLDLSRNVGAVDLHPLLEPQATPAANVAPEPDTREQLLSISDPTDLLGFYLTQTQTYPLLAPDEEISLARQIEAGVVAEALLADGIDPDWPSISTWNKHPGWLRSRPS